MESTIQLWVRIGLLLILLGTFGVMWWAISGEFKEWQKQYGTDEDDK